MTIKDLLTESTYKLNTPNYIVKRFDRLINHKNIKPNQKKILQEIKGILIGKYPTEQSLRNSVKGIKNKIGILSERVIGKIERLIYSLIYSVSLLSGVLAAGGSAAYRFLDNDLTKKAEQKINSSKTVVNGTLVVEVDEKVWKDIDTILNKLEAELSKGDGLDVAFDSVKKDFSDKGIELEKHPGSSYAGYYNSKDKKIVLNTSAFDREKAYLTKDNEFIKTVANNIKLKTAEYLRHELTHKAQFDKVKFVVGQLLNMKYDSNGNDSYERSILEIGAYHASIQQRINDSSEQELIKVMDQKTPQILRNILEVYPSTDPVVKAIMANGSKCKEVDSTINMTKDQSAKIRDYISALQKNREAIKVVRADLKQ